MAGKFLLVLAAVAPALLAVAWVGIAAQHRATAQAEDLYTDHVLEAQDLAAVDRQVGAIGRLAFEMISETNAAELADQRTRLFYRLLPRADGAIATLKTSATAEDRQLWADVAQGWREFDDALAQPAFQRTSRGVTSPETNDQLARTLSSALSPVDESIAALQDKQTNDAHDAIVSLQQDSSDTQRRILIIVAAAILFGVGSVLLLIKNVLPRVRDYSRFAAEVAAGRLEGRLAPTGHDELSELGRTLNTIVDRRASEREYDITQSELNEALQVTRNEDEAHHLLKRHLERSIPAAIATVLNRNNSANRLQPMTAPPEGGDLAERLRNAQPRACLAVRLARPHDTTPEDDRLLPCHVCGEHQMSSRCQPLLVGGEVIGSVLVQLQQDSTRRLSDRDERRIRESVTLAAPVLANLRNLALAEHRALNDALTGLPNQRACHDTMRQMAAQASRTITPLAAVMLDLDHFKQINDVYGHDRGDEALAAVGATLAACIRSSDFVGRYGGEEFLLLMADTDSNGAKVLAEKVRSAVAQIEVSGVDRTLTASLGVASLPNDAVDPETLIRQADRALYSAKAQGRNRVEVVNQDEGRSVEEHAST